MLEIFLEFVTRRKVALPGIVLLELVLVEEGTDIHPGIGIIIEIPGASHTLIAIDNAIGDAQAT